MKIRFDGYRFESFFWKRIKSRFGSGLNPQEELDLCPTRNESVYNQPDPDPTNVTGSGALA